MPRPTRTLDQFVAESRAIHGDRYDYTGTTYTNASTKLRLHCRQHGVFEVTPNNHLSRKSGCPACGIARSAAAKIKPMTVARARAEFVGPRMPPSVAKKYHRAQRTGGVLAELVAAAPAGHAIVRADTTHFEADCPDHGRYKKLITAALGQGQWCQSCGRARTGRARGFTSWVEQATVLHGGRFTYPDGEPASMTGKVRVICPQHGEFTADAGDHLYRKSGCPRCVSRVSKAEAEIADFIRGLGHAPVQQARVGGVCVDILVGRVAIEHNGEFYHRDHVPDGHPASPRGPDYHRHRQDVCEANGVRLIQLWGVEWSWRRPQCESLIRAALGVGQCSRIAARDTELTRVDPASARAFYEQHHIQGAGPAGQHYGLQYRGDLIACMSFSPNADRRGAGAGSYDGWNLTRFATSGHVVGGASRLLAAFRREHPGVAVNSYSDRRLFSGGVYRALGFTAVTTTAPDYTVLVPGERRHRHKSAFARKHLERWRAEYMPDAAPFDAASDTRTERQMLDELGFWRLWNAGLIRWRLAG